MAIAEAKAIANAVALALNTAREAGSLPGAWEATASEQVPQNAREDLATTKVTVVPINRRSFRESRPPYSMWRYEYDIDIGVQQQLDTQNPDTEGQLNDALMLADEIDEWFKLSANDQLTLVDANSGATAAEFIASQLAFLASEHLETMNVASSVVRATFHLWRTHD